MAEGPDVRRVADRIDALIAEFAEAGDPRIRQKAEDLVRLVMEFYGKGIERILEIAYESVAPAEPLFRRFADDPLVSSILLVHGLHPLEPEERIRRALEQLHAGVGKVEFLGIEDGAAKVRAIGGGHACGAAALEAAIRQAIEGAAPEVSRVDVEHAGAVSSLVQIAPTS